MKKIIIILCLISSLGFSQNEALFKQANTFYNEGKYTEAIDLYNRILANEQHSDNLYFNLGNAHYKLNHIAESIYNYEKAIQLNKNNTDAQDNLVFAQQMTIDAIDTIPEAGFSKLIQNITNKLHYDTWAKITVVFAIIFVVCYVLYLLAQYSDKKRLFFISSLVAFTFTLVFLSFAFQQEGFTKNNTFAIVYCQECSTQTEPNLRSDKAFSLHEGTKVKIIETIENWTKIKLTNGSEAWIFSKDIKAL